MTCDLCDLCGEKIIGNPIEAEVENNIQLDVGVCAIDAPFVRVFCSEDCKEEFFNEQ